MFVAMTVWNPAPAQAQCAMPSGTPASAGVIVFNVDHKTMQYCNGEKWVGMGSGGGTGLPVCDDGEIAQFSAGEWQCNDGSGLTNLNASNLASGTVPSARLGSGTANNTTFLRGDGTWAAPGAAVCNDVQTFNTPGTHTWTKPSCGSAALVQCWGGGGGGARLTNFLAGGGGGGAMHERRIPLSGLGASVTVTVGAGGAGRSGSNGNGSNGGNSSFGSHLTAYGGSGGQGTSAGGGGAGVLGPPVGNAGGLPSGVMGGGNAASEASTLYGGGGGNVNHMVPTAGSSVYGGAGGGQAYFAPSNAAGYSMYGGSGGEGGTASGMNGGAGQQPGGGGGGSYNGTGGKGGDGLCVVTTY